MKAFTDVEKTFWYKMQSQQLKRRNITGIYIFDKFPTDEKRQPTCIEDCQQETRRQWVMKRGDADYARQAIAMVYDAFLDLCNYLHQEGCVNDEMIKDFTEMANDKKDETKYNWGLHELATQLDLACDQICLMADLCGVERVHKDINNLKDLNDEQRNIS